VAATDFTIETERLTLHPATFDDVDGLHALWVDPDVRRYLWDDEVIPRELAASVIDGSIATFAERSFGQFVLRERSSPRDAPILGFAGLRTFGAGSERELMYGLWPARWGTGLATEAARAVLRHGFEATAERVLWAGADPQNSASFRVMERLGMTYAKRVVEHGQAAIYYSITRDGFEPGHARHVVSDGL
jgi:ribosomal-protein-alanine N-acetyltransferase